MARVWRNSPALPLHMFHPRLRHRPHVSLASVSIAAPSGRLRTLATVVDSPTHHNKIPFVPPEEAAHFILTKAAEPMSGLGASHLLPTYARVDLAFERGEGAWLIATNGERYLDFTSGVAVNALGHAHPQLIAAISEQVRKLSHVSNLYRIPEAERLAARLCDASFAEFVFFANSGAEAMECAIKMARKHQSANGKPERFRIITFE